MCSAASQGWLSVTLMLMEGKAPALPTPNKHAHGHCRNRTTTLALDYVNAFVEEKERLARRGQVLPLMCFQLCRYNATFDC